VLFVRRSAIVCPFPEKVADCLIGFQLVRGAAPVPARRGRADGPLRPIVGSLLSSDTAEMADPPNHYWCAKHQSLAPSRKSDHEMNATNGTFQQAKGKSWTSEKVRGLALILHSTSTLAVNGTNMLESSDRAPLKS
jgi:hypothetical protein